MSRDLKRKPQDEAENKNKIVKLNNNNQKPLVPLNMSISDISRALEERGIDVRPLLVKRLEEAMRKELKLSNNIEGKMDTQTMSKREQVLVIEPPNELTFHGPFTSAVSSYMKLKNPSDRKVYFQIKATAPKRLCVNPNSGVLDPKTEVQIAVSYTEYDPAKRNKHKILVKSMFPPDQDTLVLGTGCKWKWSDQWEAIDQNELMGSKLKCVFAMPPNLVEQNNIEEPKYENTRNLVMSVVEMGLE